LAHAGKIYLAYGLPTHQVRLVDLRRRKNEPGSTEYAPERNMTVAERSFIGKFRACCQALPPRLLMSLAGLGVCLLWSYWPTLAAMSQAWSHDPVYSHGYLVPLFALVLLWVRRQKLQVTSFQSDWVWGCFLLFLATVLRLGGTYFYYPWFEAVSLLPCLAGVCLLVGGRSGLAWSWPAIGFLFFMMPLPYRLETGMKQPLQRLATQASTYVLQTLGCSAFAEGNIIVLKSTRLGVEEACSGLSMLLVFLALATAVAMLVRRPLWEKGVILVSALPIAVVANVGRITATGLLFQLGRSRDAQLVFHDLAGWLMMPLGLVMIGIELKVLGRLLIVPEANKPLPISLARPASASVNGTKGKARRQRRPQRA
jgi:exosortase